MADAAQEHLLNQLRDVHAVELQALRQLARAAECADEESRSVYAEHLEQTKAHEQRIRELVEEHGYSPSPEEDKTLRGGAVGIRQLSDIPLETPAKVSMNLFALEHLEIAAWELVGEIARAVQDEHVAQAAEEIVEEERQAAENVAGTFDRAAKLVLDGEDQEALLLAHLNEIHALEQQSLQLLQTGVDELCQDEELQKPYQEHLEQTQEHERLVTERIEAHEAHPSAVKDLHFSTAKFGLHDLLKKPPDAQTKLAMNVFCVEHLEVAAYELLKRMAKEVGDSETAEMAEKIIEQEREAAEAVQGAFERSVQLMLEGEGSYEEVRAGEAPKEDRTPEGAATQ